MDRRAFLAGAALAAAAAPVVAKAGEVGTTVTIRGYLRRVTNHYYAISTSAQKNDPNTTNYAAWPSEVVRVYPKDAKQMVLGLVTVKGVLHRAHQQDAFSRTVSTVFMTGAVMA